MGEIIDDITNKTIKEIYYSDSYSNSIFTVFIDLENGSRFRLSGYGASYADANKKFNDLYPINVDENIMPREMFIGKRIKEIAMELNLSPRTVETYLNNIKRSFNRTALRPVKTHIFTCSLK